MKSRLAALLLCATGIFAQSAGPRWEPLQFLSGKWGGGGTGQPGDVFDVDGGEDPVKWRQSRGTAGRFGAEVFTLDADFRIDRRHGNKVVPVLMPD